MNSKKKNCNIKKYIFIICIVAIIVGLAFYIFFKSENTNLQLGGNNNKLLDNENTIVEINNILKKFN